MIGTLTVDVIRSGGRDEWGDTLPPRTFKVHGCAFAPRSSEENNDFANTVITGASLFAPWDADIEPSDQIRIHGKVYEIEGEVGLWIHAHNGAPAGIQAALTRVTG